MTLTEEIDALKRDPQPDQNRLQILIHLVCRLSEKIDGTKPSGGVDRPLAGNRPAKQADNPGATSADYRTCPKCGAKWTGEVEKCPECEARVPQPATEPLKEEAEFKKWIATFGGGPLSAEYLSDLKDGWMARAALALRDVPQGQTDRDVIAEKERLEIKTWIEQQRADYQSLPEYGATSHDMFRVLKGRMEGYKHVLDYLHERDSPMISLTEAADYARKARGEFCTMCDIGDTPTNGLHRGKHKCGLAARQVPVGPAKEKRDGTKTRD